MKCPKCEKDMEHGYLTAEKQPMSLGYAPIQANWDMDNDPFGSSEDFIALPEEGCGSFVIEGNRCQSCRVLLLSY